MKKFIALASLSMLLTACTPSGEDLQGRFGTSTSPSASLPTVTMTLSASSPSGNRVVSAADDILMFDLKASSKTSLPAGTNLSVSLSTDADLDPATSGTSAIDLYSGGVKVGSGTFTVIDLTNPSEGTAWITTTSAVSFGLRPTTFTVRANTVTVLAEDTGVDDEVVVTVEMNGNKVTGNTLKY